MEGVDWGFTSRESANTGQRADYFVQHGRIAVHLIKISSAIQNFKLNHLIFFAFNLIVSPFTKMPFPLYGSGTLHFLIFAAN